MKNYIYFISFIIFSLMLFNYFLVQKPVLDQIVLTSQEVETHKKSLSVNNEEGHLTDRVDILKSSINRKKIQGELNYKEEQIELSLYQKLQLKKMFSKTELKDRYKRKIFIKAVNGNTSEHLFLKKRVKLLSTHLVNVGFQKNNIIIDLLFLDDFKTDVIARKLANTVKVSF